VQIQVQAQVQVEAQVQAQAHLSEAFLHLRLCLHLRFYLKLVVVKGFVAWPFFLWHDHYLIKLKLFLVLFFEKNFEESIKTKYCLAMQQSRCKMKN
jgi:hypothetical protein